MPCCGSTELRRDYVDQTWVAFDRAGNITVNITKGHYDLFRENLSFEKLCQSLGNLFSEFLDMYARGDGEKIIDRLNSVRENPFTEKRGEKWRCLPYTRSGN